MKAEGLAIERQARYNKKPHVGLHVANSICTNSRDMCTHDDLRSQEQIRHSFNLKAFGPRLEYQAQHRKFVYPKIFSTYEDYKINPGTKLDLGSVHTI